LEGSELVEIRRVSEQIGQFAPAGVTAIELPQDPVAQETRQAAPGR
jgi:hypothetical protein